MFDLDDFDAAIAELDARYLAGEAAAHAGTWSVIAGAFVAHNRRELAATTPDVVSIDHRRVAAFAPGEGIEYIRAGWDLDQNLNIYIETAHRVNDLGAVFTWAGHGTSHEGFDAEWRGVNLMTVDGEMVSRMRGIRRGRPRRRAREVRRAAADRHRVWKTRQAKWLSASWRTIAARDWDAMAEILADDFSSDDRRRVVGAGVRHGRDAEIANMRAIAESVDRERDVDRHGDPRGAPCPLRGRFSGRDQGPEAFVTEVLGIVEINADERIVAVVMFDPDDIDAAFAELDARYLAGEAARTRTRGRSSRRLRRAQPARAPAINTGLGEHRPPVTGNVRGGRIERKPPCCLGPHAGPQGPYRGCASAERPGSGRHPCGAWDLARRL